MNGSALVCDLFVDESESERLRALADERGFPVQFVISTAVTALCGHHSKELDDLIRSVPLQRTWPSRIESHFSWAVIAMAADLFGAVFGVFILLAAMFLLSLFVWDDLISITRGYEVATVIVLGQLWIGGLSRFAV